jgi:cell division protein FtsL
MLVGIFVLALGLVAARVVVEAQAARLQQLQGAIQRAEYRERALALQVAQLEAPSRVEAYASTHLGLQAPSYVNVVSGDSLAGSVALPNPEGAPGAVPLPAGVVQRGP